MHTFVMENKDLFAKVRGSYNKRDVYAHSLIALDDFGANTSP
jgi:hypothetical protein